MIAQNELCPCGSGIKYGDCCANKRKDSQQPRTDAAFEEVKELLEGRNFASLEEANAFLSRHMQQRNRAPSDDFDGLSPEHMHRFLYFPFESPELVSFPSCLDVSPEAPILTLFHMLFEALGDKGVKATVTGNLPRNLCRDIAMAYMGEEKYREYCLDGELRSEREFFKLHVTRLVSGLAGFIRKYRGRFAVSGGCRKIMAKHGSAGIYPKLFREFTTRYNWAYRDNWQQIDLIQQSFPFTLYLLEKYGSEWQTNSFYEDRFLRAFPGVLPHVAPVGNYYSPEQVLRGSYSLRCLHSFAAFLGLAEIQQDPGERHNVFRLRKLPLLDHVVRFHL